MKYLLLGLSMTLAVIGQLLLKKGVMASSLNSDLTSVVKTFLTPFVFFGIASYALSAVSWLFVLKNFPLSVAYPALSLTYVVIVVASFFLFKEPFTTFKIIGIVLIISGVYFLFR